MTEGEIARACCLHRGVDEHRVKKRSFTSVVGYAYCFRTYSLYLSFRHGVLILYRRATFLLRGRQGRSRAAHRFSFAVKVRCKRYPLSPIQPLSLFAPQGQKASSPCTGEPRRLPPQATEFSKVRTAVKPALAGCPHPSRCSAKAQHRATFPKGKALRPLPLCRSPIKMCRDPRHT